MFNFSSKGRFSLNLAGVSAALLLSSSVMASGSFGGPAGIGLHNSYNLGKSLYYRKLACEDCPLANQKMDVMGAKKLIDKLNEDENFAKGLKGIKRNAVIVYLQRRYKAG